MEVRLYFRSQNPEFDHFTLLYCIGRQRSAKILKRTCRTLVFVFVFFLIQTNCFAALSLASTSFLLLALFSSLQKSAD